MQMLIKARGSDQDQAADELQKGPLVVLSSVLTEPTDGRPPSTTLRADKAEMSESIRVLLGFLACIAGCGRTGAHTLLSHLSSLLLLSPCL